MQCTLSNVRGFQLFQGQNVELVAFLKRHCNFDPADATLQSLVSSPGTAPLGPLSQRPPWSTGGRWVPLVPCQWGVAPRFPPRMETSTLEHMECRPAAPAVRFAGGPFLGHSVTRRACYDPRAIPRLLLPLPLPNKLKAYSMFRVLGPDVLSSPCHVYLGEPALSEH